MHNDHYDHTEQALSSGLREFFFFLISMAGILVLIYYPWHR